MTDQQVDVLIIGAGASGAVAAHTLASEGFSVVCLEQGDWVNPEDLPGNKPEFELLTRRRWAWDPNERQLPADYPVNTDNADVHPIMFNGVGGGTVLYGGHWMRLTPSDFRVYTVDGVADDWPIDHRDLDPFYNEVDAFLGVAGLGGDPAYTEQDFPLPPHPIGPAGVRAATGMNKLGWHWWPGTNAIPSSRFKNMGQCVRWGVCERGCPAGAKASFDIGYWPHATAVGAQLVTGARVARITLDAQGLANGAVWLDQRGVERRTRASSVVVAANGIGTPRLLLMSDNLANSSGLVGKNLMMHPNCAVTGVYDEELQSWNGPAGQLIYSMEFYETDTAPWLPARCQMEPDADSWRAWHSRDVPPPALRPAVGTGPARAIAARRQGDQLGGERRRPARGVQPGHPGSRPHRLQWPAAPAVSYRISDNTQRNIDFSLDRMTEAHEAAGAVHTHRVPLWVDAPGHLLGTARMGDDPATSVVDRFGRAHDVPNLFIIDAASWSPAAGSIPRRPSRPWRCARRATWLPLRTPSESRHEHRSAVAERGRPAARGRPRSHPGDDSSPAARDLPDYPELLARAVNALALRLTRYTLL